MTTTTDVGSLPLQANSWPAALEEDRPSEPPLSAQYKIMVVDDTPVNLKVISAYLAREGYQQIDTVQDSREALATLLRKGPDLLLLDLMMPHVSGLDILETIREIPDLRRLPVIVITAAEEREMKTKSLELGATDFLSKPVDAEDLILRVRNTLELKSYQDSLEEKVHERTADLRKSREDVIHCLARAAEYRDNETGHHVIRVGRYVGMMARHLGADAQTSHMMELASTLHDMGKIGIPDSILLKPGPLTEDERKEMMKHCEFGAEICTPGGTEASESGSAHAVTGGMMFSGSASPLLQMATRIAVSHHERWDGGGYPRGLKGEKIPIEGRITAVADVFDALSSKRPYKEPFPLDKCFGIIDEDAGKHFDPQVVEAFRAKRSDVISVHDTYRDEF